MALYLVGETIDAKAAHKRAQASEITQLTRGVYVGREDGDSEPLRYAVRIAHYLYPQAYLSSASALTLAPTSDGRLFLSGRRNQRTRLRALEIVQNAAPAAPSTLSAVSTDELGELRIEVASPRQRFLEAFRLRSEHASALGPELRKQMAERLIEEYGSPRAAADALWTLARANQWYREGEGAERYLLQQATFVPVQSVQLDYAVAWHAAPLGALTHDGVDWRWRAAANMPPLVRDTKPGRLPPFIEALLPEGWLEQVLSERDDREAIRNGRRYMSNLTIVPRGEASSLPADVLITPLSAFRDANGYFNGRYAGPTRGELNDTFEQNLARLFARREMPRLSGVQIKAPMCLLADGSLVPAVDRPFTHILKPAGSAGFEHLPIIEWLCLELGRAAGFEVPSAALIEMPDGMPSALLVERFDIRRDAQDQRLLALEDFCSLLELPATAKYDSSIERCGKALRAASSDPGADLAMLLRRALFAWLIGDGDMHLKNLAVLRVAQPGSSEFSSVRFAPLYDAVSTRVFPRLAGDHMALKLNGRDDRLGTDDFVAAARTMGIAATAARAACRELAERLTASAPTLPASATTAAPMLELLRGIISTRSAALLGVNGGR